MISWRKKKTPLRFRFFEIIYLSLLKLFPSSARLKKNRKNNQRKAIEHFMKSHPPGSEGGKVISIDKHDFLSRKDFIKNYVNKGIPVIFKNEMKDWTCSKKWSLDALAEKYGEDEYHIIATEGFVPNEESKEYKANGIKGESAGKYKLKEIINRILNKETIYLRLFPLLENHPELLNDLNTPWLKKMSRSVMGVIYHTFIGHEKRRTLCHNGSTGFFSLMVIGSKKWTLWDTSYFPLLNMPADSRGYYYSDIFQADQDVLKKNPHYKFIDRYEATVKEGDILYCPAWMFHAAENKSLTLAVRYGVFDPIDYLLSSLGFTLMNIFVSSFPTLLLHSIQGKSHDRDINQKSSKIVRR